MDIEVEIGIASEHIGPDADNELVAAAVAAVNASVCGVHATAGDRGPWRGLTQSQRDAVERAIDSAVQ
jgi:hypothetical protein